jgi:thymidylate synthase
MNEKVREFLKGINEKEGFAADDKSLIETLTEGKRVWDGDDDEHRHWIEFTRVVQIEDRFFSFGWAKGAGDQGIYDAGWEFDPDTIQEVVQVKKVVEVTEYVPVKE